MDTGMSKREHLGDLISRLLNPRWNDDGDKKKCLMTSLFRCVSHYNWKKEVSDDVLCQTMGEDLLGRWSTVAENLQGDKGFPLPNNKTRSRALHREVKENSNGFFDKVKSSR